MTKALTRVVVLLAMLLAITPPVAAQQPRDPLETMRQIQALRMRTSAASRASRFPRACRFSVARSSVSP